MNNLKQGDRVELVKTTDQYTDLAPGTRGVMVVDAPEPSTGIPVVAQDGTRLSEYTILSIKWDNGSWLMMIPEAGDVVKKIEPDAKCPTCGGVGQATENIHGGEWKCPDGHIFKHAVVVTKIA